jgi:hypothetical protein
MAYTDLYRQHMKFGEYSPFMPHLQHVEQDISNIPSQFNPYGNVPFQPYNIPYEGFGTEDITASQFYPQVDYGKGEIQDIKQKQGLNIGSQFLQNPNLSKKLGFSDYLSKTRKHLGTSPVLYQDVDPTGSYYDTAYAGQQVIDPKQGPLERGFSYGEIGYGGGFPNPFTKIPIDASGNIIHGMDPTAVTQHIAGGGKTITELAARAKGLNVGQVGQAGGLSPYGGPLMLAGTIGRFITDDKDPTTYTTGEQISEAATGAGAGIKLAALLGKTAAAPWAIGGAILANLLGKRRKKRAIKARAKEFKKASRAYQDYLGDIQAQRASQEYAAMASQYGGAYNVGMYKYGGKIKYHEGGVPGHLHPHPEGAFESTYTQTMNPIETSMNETLRENQAQGYNAVLFNDQEKHDSFWEKIYSRQRFKESRFDNQAYNIGSQATGQGQITPIALQDAINRGWVADTTTMEDLRNPDINERLQTRIMQNLMTRTWNLTGDDQVRTAKALAAYNWGASRLVSYLNNQKDNNIDIYNSFDWLDDLPLETRDYIQKILLERNDRFNTEYNTAISATENIDPEQEILQEGDGPGQNAPVEYKHGGGSNISGNITGQELIINPQDQEKIESGNVLQAGKIIETNIQEGNITPGAASHQANNMKIYNSGQIEGTDMYVGDGSGIYDHAKKFNFLTIAEKGAKAKSDIENWKKIGTYNT